MVFMAASEPITWTPEPTFISASSSLAAVCYFDLADSIIFPATANARPTQNGVERSISGQPDCFCQARRRTMKQPAQTNGPPMKSILPV